jgi:hypothetical protein
MIIPLFQSVRTVFPFIHFILFYFQQTSTEQIRLTATSCTRMLEIFSWNVGRDTGSPEALLGTSQSLDTNADILPQISTIASFEISFNSYIQGTYAQLVRTYIRREHKHGRSKRKITRNGGSFVLRQTPLSVNHDIQ